MKVGILNYRQYPYISANTAIGYTIGESISRQNDFEVVFIGRRQDEKQFSGQEYKGNKICFLNEKLGKGSQRIRDAARRYISESLFLNSDAKALREIVEKEKIGVLICVIAPIDNARIVWKAKLSIPCVLYQLDPFYNLGDKIDKKKRREFLNILSAFKAVFTTSLLMTEYKRDRLFKKQIKKFFVAEFPLLKPSNMKNAIEKDSTVVRLLYAGTLYHIIRTPRILLELKRVLPEKHEMVFCGECDDETDFQSLKNSGIICKGRITPDQLEEEYKKADILINIGNTVKNQMGSKLIGYIATGKPILNIVQIEDCCTIDCLSKYIYKLNVSASEIFEQKERIMEFLKNKNSYETYQEIEKKYIKYTPDYVAKQILTVVE